MTVLNISYWMDFFAEKKNCYILLTLKFTDKNKEFVFLIEINTSQSIFLWRESTSRLSGFKTSESSDPDVLNEDNLNSNVIEEFVWVKERKCRFLMMENNSVHTVLT